MTNVVAAIIINDQEEIFIAQRSHPKELIGKWEFPGGKIEAGETPEDSLIREISEEFGIKINVDRFLLETVYEYNFSKVRILFYLAYWESGEIEVREHNDADWIKINEISNYEFVPADIKVTKKIREEKDELFSCFSESNL